MFSGGLNEVMSPDDDGISQQSFNGLKMKKDVVLTVGGDVVIHLIAEDAQTGTVAAMYLLPICSMAGSTKSWDRKALELHSLTMPSSPKA